MRIILITQIFNIKENNTNIDIKVIYEPLDDDHFGVVIKSVINCKTKKNKDNVFHLELDYFGFFKIEKVNSYDRDKLSSEGAKIIFPFARSIIANITQNGGSIPIVLDNPDFNLLKSKSFKLSHILFGISFIHSKCN